MKELSIEDKELLLKDLCARLPYGVKFKTTNISTTTLKSIGIESMRLIPINLFYKKPEFYLINEFGNIEYKPYLRPMSSMTEEEKKEYQALQIPVCSYHYEFGDIVDDILYFDTDVSFDYLNSIHIDYRGLIEKGLALEAPEGMYDSVE